MNISFIVSNNEVYLGWERLQGSSFKNTVLGADYTLLQVICNKFGRMQDNFALLNRIEYLSPLRCSAC